MDIESFTGEIPARIDGKGRLTIPAEVRRAVERGDPAWSQGMNPRMQVNYGDHLGACLKVWTAQAFRAMEREITDWQPATEEDEVEKESAAYFMLTQSQPFEIDRDGRVVLPARLREKLGLPEGDLVLAGKGDHFEIWAEATYEAEVRAPKRAFRAGKPRNWNPMTAVRAKGA